MIAVLVAALVTTTATYHLPQRAYPEITVQCPGFVQTQVGPEEGPWVATWSPPPSESCTATLFYYPRSYRHLKPPVVLDVVPFQT